VAKGGGDTNTKGDDGQDRVVCRNRRARHDYDILETLACGIALLGSEVKSLRNNRVSLDEAYARIEGGEVWLHNADIAEYPQANVMNHEPRRPRKLLLKRREIRKFAEEGDHSGFTLVPLDLFFRRGIAKVTLAVAKGRKQHDKRQALKKADAGREMREALKSRR
jgi:SsrA-binding protein